MFARENELKDLWHELVVLFHNKKLRESAEWEQRGWLGSNREGDAFVHQTSQQTGLFCCYENL